MIICSTNKVNTNILWSILFIFDFYYFGVFFVYMCSILTKGSTCRKNKKNEIFVDLSRAGHDKFVEKKLFIV